MKNRIVLLIALIITGCTADDPFVSTFELKDKWELIETVAPNYPMAEMSDTTLIYLAFPKNEEYELDLSTFSCTGTYLAKQSGSMDFKRSNCTQSCCMTNYDLYIFTLLKKVESFSYDPENSLILLINDANYLTFKYKESSSVF